MDEDAGPAGDLGYVGPPELDVEKYRRYLESLNLSGEQEDEVLAVLWQIAGTVARIGWGVNSVQLIFGRIIESAMAEEEFEVEKEVSKSSPVEAAPAAKPKGPEP